MKFSIQNPLNGSHKNKGHTNLYAYNQPMYKRNSMSSKNNKKMRIKSRPASVKVRGEKILVSNKDKRADKRSNDSRKQNFLKITGGSKGYGKGI